MKPSLWVPPLLRWLTYLLGSLALGLAFRHTTGGWYCAAYWVLLVAWAFGHPYLWTFSFKRWHRWQEYRYRQRYWRTACAPVPEDEEI